MNEELYAVITNIIDDISPKLPGKIASLEDTKTENVLNDFDEIVSCLISVTRSLHDKVLALEEKLNDLDRGD